MKHGPIQGDALLGPPVAELHLMAYNLYLILTPFIKRTQQTEEIQLNFSFKRSWGIWIVGFDGWEA